jgi:hypothetical protein
MVRKNAVNAGLIFKNLNIKYWIRLNQWTICEYEALARVFLSI